jgi:hypothetical protein
MIIERGEAEPVIASMARDPYLCLAERGLVVSVMEGAPGHTSPPTPPKASRTGRRDTTTSVALSSSHRRRMTGLTA